MSIWNKKTVSKELVKKLTDRYKIDPITASILSRRDITSGQDIMYYLEDDLRFQHSPFLFSTMEDAVDRILDAKENGEKVLIFGDRDVDGVASTTLLYTALKGLGFDDDHVEYRLPEGDDAYGLSMQAVDDFAQAGGTLIITVDCGISNNAEVAHAADKCIDVIIVDHHNAPDMLPEPAVIVNPKVPGSGYPFQDISGCAVAYKLACALRFSKTELYKQDICLLHVRPINEAYTVECIKIRNLVPVDQLNETIVPGTISIEQTRLIPFLDGQQIFVWNAELTAKQLGRIFGTGIEFNMLDMQPEIGKIMPSVADKSLLTLKDMSKIAFYKDGPASEIEGFYNLFVTYAQKMQAKTWPADSKAEEADLQLVMLAAISDIMPLQNENRIFVRRGLDVLNEGRARAGLKELLARLCTPGKRITSTDVSWIITPTLNAAGRLGQPELALRLFLAETPAERDALAEKIISLNTERKQKTEEAWVLGKSAAENVKANGGNLCVVIDERIDRGITGILASRLMQCCNVPTLVVTFIDNGNAVGSMRSCREYDATVFLNQFGDLFLNHGGHTYAAGFSFKKERLQEFTDRIAQLAPAIELAAPDETINVDAELPPQYMTPDLLKLVDRFEPFGAANKQLTFMSKSLPISDIQVLGKTERQHLKITFNCGTGKCPIKWPAMFWGEAERLHRDFEKNDRLDILYHIQRNTFNGMETPQLILLDLKKSE